MVSKLVQNKIYGLCISRLHYILTDKVRSRNLFADSTVMLTGIINYIFYKDVDDNYFFVERKQKLLVKSAGYWVRHLNKKYNHQ